MAYTPAPDREWIIEAAYEGDPAVRQTLAAMVLDSQAPGYSDIGIRNLLYTLVLNLRPRRVLEVGTHIGSAAVVIGAALALNRYGELITLEPYEGHRARALDYLGQAGVGERVRVLPFASS